MAEIIQQVVTDSYAIYNGDCVDVLRELESEKIGFSIFSPPFCRPL